MARSREKRQMRIAQEKKALEEVLEKKTEEKTMRNVRCIEYTIENGAPRALPIIWAKQAPDDPDKLICIFLLSESGESMTVKVKRSDFDHKTTPIEIDDLS